MPIIFPVASCNKYFEVLEKWLCEWKNSRILFLDRLAETINIWDKKHCIAYNNHKLRKQVEVKDWSSTKGYYIKTVNAIPVVINDKEYLDYEYTDTGRNAYFKDCSIGDVSKEDEQLAIYYSHEERVHRVEKDVESKRKGIIAKVQKICTIDIIEVAEVAGDGLYIKGANGKVAHMWAIFAGGYNIQCFHIRIMVKESKWF